MRSATRIVRAVITTLAVIFCTGALVGCPPRPLSTVEVLQRSPFFLKCGGVGEACCTPPGGAMVSGVGPLVACNVGLGCNLQTNTCVQPCGGTGQVCCDGPETNAPKWTANGMVYSPNTWDMQDMCRAGACDIQSHRCFACGAADGQACCPPDAAHGTAHCVGQRLTCELADPRRPFSLAGTCIKCGIRGRPPCGDWEECDPGLGLLKKLCEVCGGDGQQPCDAGCRPGLGKAGGLCRACGAVNQIPCDTGCNIGLGVRGGVCAACGNVGQAPCDSGCKAGMRSINGVCQLCGGLNQPPCAKGCTYPYRVAGGVCKPCGGLGQVPCDLGCDGGLVIINNQCSKPATSELPTCAQLGEGCVADHVQGTHCCKPPNTPTPLICIPPGCKACVPRGETCQAFGNQTCCTPGDVCRLELETQKTTCGIPD